MVDRDPVDALRDAWAELTPPAPDHDAASDALVEDLRAAWRAVDAPPSDPRTFQRALVRRQRERTWADRAVLAAAASLVFALVLVARSAPTQRFAGEEQMASHDAETAHATNTVPEPHGADPRVRKLPDEVRAQPLQGGGLELRHGRVRLVLGGHSNIVTESLEQAAHSAVDPEEDSK